MTNLILASGSANRQQALTIAKIPFKAAPADIDEKSIIGKNIYDRVVNIAKAKVEAISKHHQGLILGADGVNLCKDQVLEKPTDKSDAKRMLELQSGNECSFLTGYFLYNTHSKVKYSGTSECKYWFRELGDEEIDRYIGTEPVFNWAAAFSPINSMAITFVEKVEGPLAEFCYSMPFEKLMPIFKKEGVI